MEPLEQSLWIMDKLEEWQRYTIHNLEYNIKNGVPYGDITDFSKI